jgi:hypothetical protein
VADGARGADYAIWAVALLLYLIDAARLLAPREVLLAEAGRGRLAPRLGDNPFTLGGRILAIAPLLRPDRGVFVAPWGAPWIDDARLGPTLASLAGLRRALPTARVLASTAFVLLFAVGPVLTLGLGPSAAVLSTAALVYPTALAAIGWMWRRRRALGLAAPRCAWLTFELLVCPAFLPNLVRKITAGHAIDADAAQVLVGTRSDVDDEFLARLERRVEELLDGSDADDLRGAWSRYLATVRGAR